MNVRIRYADVWSDGVSFSVNDWYPWTCIEVSDKLKDADSEQDVQAALEESFDEDGEYSSIQFYEDGTIFVEWTPRELVEFYEQENYEDEWPALPVMFEIKIAEEAEEGAYD